MKNSVDRQNLDRLIATAYLDSKLSIKDCAKFFGCSIHRIQNALKRTGTRSRSYVTPKGAANPNWKGGLSFDGRYIRVRDSENNKYVRQHRKVMEEKIGRKLRPGETVHHDNENTIDNADANLCLFPSNSEHLRHHAKTRNRQQGRFV